MPALGLPILNPAPSRAAIASLFEHQRAKDPIGIRIHDALALAAVFLAGWPTTFVEWAWVPLSICALIRLTGYIHVPGPLLWDRALQLILGWVAILLASRLWTVGDHHAWVNDIQSLRFIVLLPALYMVMDRRPALIKALALGILCGQVSQAAHIAGRTLDIHWLTWNRLPGRDSGWWDPVVGGSILCVGLGLHLGACLTPRCTRERVLGTIGVIVSLICITLTGTRGAMVAAAALVLAAVARRLMEPIAPAIASSPSPSAPTPSPRRSFPKAPLLLAILLAAALAATPPLRARLTSGISEVQRAITTRDYASDTGMRIAAWRWASLEFAAHPLLGVGGGGYRAWASQHAPDHPDLPPVTLPHAHSAYFHALAVTGILGFAFLFSGLAWAVRSGLRDPDDHHPLRGYAAGPALALLGLLLAGLFDTIEVNQQTASLMFILLALCLPTRPPTRYRTRPLNTRPAFKHVGAAP